MKVAGFVVIVLGLVLGYVGITGSQHRLMATITGKPIAPPNIQTTAIGGKNNPPKHHVSMA